MKNYYVKLGVCLIAAACFAGMAAMAPAENILANGDFENTTGWGAIGSTSPPPGWTMTPVNPAGQQSGLNAIGGIGTSAYMPKGTGKLLHSFSETDPLWRLDIDLACEDPGGADDRTHNSSISGGTTGTTIFITYRVNGDGDFQVYDGLSAIKLWYTPTGLSGAIDFDDDVTTTPLVNHIKIVGRFDLTAPNYDVVVTDSSGNIQRALGVAYWNKAIPTTGQGIKKIEYPTSTMTPAGEYVFDNIALANVPEPGAMVLLLGVLTGLLFCRRRN